MNYKTLKNRLGTAAIAGTLLLNSVIPSYAGWKEIKESASRSWKYVKNHKWYFIAGGTALVGAVCYSQEQKRKQEEEERRKNPFNDNDHDGYPNGEEGREGSNPDDPNSKPQDDAWKELSINSFNPVRTAMPSKLETAVSDKFEISGPIVPIYINLGKNSICSEIGKDKFRIYFNHKF